MLPNLKEYLKIDDISKAADLLNAGAGKTKIVAGCTSLVKSINPKIETLIELTNSSLKKINETEYAFEIGAYTRINELMRHNELKKYFYDCCITLAAEPLRNLITVGGNIIQLYPWSNLPVLLAVLDCQINLFNDKKIAISEFFKIHPLKMLNNDDILVSVNINKPEKNRIIKFARHSKTSFDYSVAAVALSFKREKKYASDLRIAVGALGPLPLRLYDIENKYSDKEYSIELLENLYDDIKKNINPVKDFRVSQDFKKHITAVMIKQILKETLEL